jgi:hypothetical protein
MALKGILYGIFFAKLLVTIQESGVRIQEPEWIEDRPACTAAGRRIRGIYFWLFLKMSG